MPPLYSSDPMPVLSDVSRIDHLRMPPVFRWFPDGKVIFLAPSKPLVAQQIDACHKTCGIPGSLAAELTGETSRGKRLKFVCIGSSHTELDNDDVHVSVGREASILHDATDISERPRIRQLRPKRYYSHCDRCVGLCIVLGQSDEYFLHRRGP